MNTIRKITFTHFRNYALSRFDFDTTVTCIAGPNGSGKTSLLDGIYYLCYTKSYFVSNQAYCVQTGADGFRLEGVFSGPGSEEECISCKWKAGKKEMSADGVPYERITDHIGRYAAVMIAPDDIEIINEGSELRRRWIDSILGQVDRQYLQSLLYYQKFLQQRNAWLKMNAQHSPAEDAELEFYNQQLSFHATYIHAQRKDFLQRFKPLLTEFYRSLSSGNEEIDMSYRSDLDQQTAEQWFRDGLEQDLRMQRSLRGIHKDDLLLGFNNLSLKQYGSQGQKKSYLFALKLAQHAFLCAETGRAPILLLDDIFEKLDQQRMESLLRIIRGPGFGQVIVTDTHAGRVASAFGEGADLGFIRLEG